MKIVLRWSINLIILFLLFIIASSIFSIVQAKLNPKAIPSFLGLKPFTILSGSMQPFLEKGDMILVKPVEAEKIEAGDVITFRMDEETLVSHGVVDLSLDEDGISRYITKGDANETEDIQPIGEDQLIGKFLLSIPKGGYLAKFTQTPKGIILFIFLPVALLIIPKINKGTGYR